MDIAKAICSEFNQLPAHIDNIIKLIDEGNTIPFIARYRKELTGSMDDQLLRDIADKLGYLRNMDKRRAEIVSAIDALGKLTPELSTAAMSAATLSELEDIYRPYRQKRRTRATIAREKGLEPLAQGIFTGKIPDSGLVAEGAKYIDEENGVLCAEDALAGASDIIAEDISDSAEIRKSLRELFMKTGVLHSRASKQEDSVYRTYYDFSQGVATLQSHRILAINRGEKEDFLKVQLEVAPEPALDIIKKRLAAQKLALSAFVLAAAQDSYIRLIAPSVEREIRAQLTQDASEQAIRTFALNLRPLLLQPPVKNKVTMGLDPAYRTGCKIAVVDATGKVLDTAVVYPTPPHNETEKSRAVLKRLIQKHGVQVISIGNGTASKESEIFVSQLIKETPGVSYMMVNEAGASVYSASKQGAAEFPDFDVTQRSAVSIARRLQDPLAELVKIDPRSIGVGQYQHDMPPAQLEQALSAVVEDCVNAVGADINTASAALLSWVAGIGPALAKNIVAYREANGAFGSRAQLLKVPKLGAKAYEQCAGFLRVPGGKEILDNTSVHPESYSAARSLIELCGCTPADIAAGTVGAQLTKNIAKLGEQSAAASCKVGIPTLRDIVSALAKPGRDMRDELPAPLLRTDVMDIKDIKEGMTFTGTVRNVVDFGAFVDISVHQDGLVHISEICDKYIKHPSEVLKVGDIVKVVVLGVEPQKNRISLSIKRAAGVQKT